MGITIIITILTITKRTIIITTIRITIIRIREFHMQMYRQLIMIKKITIISINIKDINNNNISTYHNTLKISKLPTPTNTQTQPLSSHRNHNKQRYHLQINYLTIMMINYTTSKNICVTKRHTLIYGIITHKDNMNTKSNSNSNNNNNNIYICRNKFKREMITL